MHRMVIQSFLRLKKAYFTDILSNADIDVHKYSFGLSEKDMSDAMLCEAFRSSCQYVDKRLRLTSHSGTTMSSIFLRQDENDDSIRVLCSNIGDSRTVMITCEEMQVASFDPESKFESQVQIIESKSSSKKAFMSDPVTEVSDDATTSVSDDIFGTKFDTSASNSFDASKYIGESDHSCVTAITDFSTRTLTTSERNVGDVLNVSNSSSRLGADIQGSTHSSVSYRRLSKLYAMSDDHNLHLERERKRLLLKKEIQFHSLPISHDSVQNNFFAAEEFINSLVKAIEKESPQDGKYFQKWQDNDSTDLIDYTPTNEPEIKVVFGYRSTSSGRGLNPSDFQLVRNESFIARRRGSNGELGPEAVFGRYNVSVMMTRSLGDRYGPSRCRGS